MTARTRRIETVKAMDYFITHKVEDENIIDTWLSVGCPDCSTEDDYEYFADDEDEYADLVDLFIRLVNRSLKS